MFFNGLKRIWLVIKSWFVKDFEDVSINCEHIYDHTCPQPGGFISYNNVHGFKVNENEYYCGVDMRVCGIRCQDILIKCNTRDKCDKYCELGGDSGQIIGAAKSHGGRSGSDVNTKYNFYFGGGDKSFNIRLSNDLYAEDMTNEEEKTEVKETKKKVTKKTTKKKSS